MTELVIYHPLITYIILLDSHNILRILVVFSSNVILWTDAGPAI